MIKKLLTVYEKNERLHSRAVFSVFLNVVKLIFCLIFRVEIRNVLKKFFFFGAANFSAAVSHFDVNFTVY